MEISDVRKRLHATIERAKQRAAERRSRATEATVTFDKFLSATAVPLFRQLSNVLRSEGYLFNVFTPSGSVRLISDRVAEDFIELTLDTTSDTPQVVCHASRVRGRRVVESEQAVGEVGTLTEEMLLELLLRELEPFVDR